MSELEQPAGAEIGISHRMMRLGIAASGVVMAANIMLPGIPAAASAEVHPGIDIVSDYPSDTAPAGSQPTTAAEYGPTSINYLGTSNRLETRRTVGVASPDVEAAGGTKAKHVAEIIGVALAGSTIFGIAMGTIIGRAKRRRDLPQQW